MPDSSLLLLVVIILLAVGFGVSNGFNDAANSIATAIGSRAVSPRNALFIAVVAEFAGAATGQAVARTIGKGILVPEAISYLTVVAALASVILWTTVATRLGLPVSLSHGFIAAMAAAGMAVVGSGAVNWGVMYRIVGGVFLAPVLGFIGGFALMVAFYWLFRKSAPDRMRSIFSKWQYLAAFFMAYSHGKNDGQMPIGVITMALVIYTGQVTLWEDIPWWIIAVSALAISSGAAMGGWRVIRTLGSRVTTMRPVQGFTAQASAAVVIEAASQIGLPVSTTHCITASIMGVGSTRRFSAVRWGLAGNIVSAWILTFPICGGMGYLFAWLLHLAF